MEQTRKNLSERLVIFNQNKLIEKEENAVLYIMREPNADIGTQWFLIGLQSSNKHTAQDEFYILN